MSIRETKDLTLAMIETGDLPIIIQLDPEEPDTEDDMVILSSIDGIVRRKINISKEGSKMDENNTKIVFNNIPLNKTYNVLVDTGETQYYLLKNFHPGGDE